MRRNSPYQDLYPFAEEDAAYFFGRESEICLLADKLLASRLTVVYGESGAGKSSLLRAGVAAKLNEQARQQHKRFGESEFCAVVFRDWSFEPAAGILEAAVDSLAYVQGRDAGEWRCPARHLDQGLATCRERFGFKGDFLIILDQFEDLLQYSPDAGGKDGFGDQFVGLLGEPDACAHFLLALREDSLATLDFFKSRISRLLDNRIRVEHLSKTAAKLAILEPLGRWKKEFGDQAGPVELDSRSAANEVVEEIIAAQERHPGMGGGTVQASLLQLVMTRWWERELKQGSTQMRLATLQTGLGGVASVARTHFTEKVKSLDAMEQKRANALFGKMVTSAGRKIAQTAAELAGEKSQHEPTQALLDKLYAARIVATVTPPRGSDSQERCYEFTHDGLAQAALEWRRERARIEAEKEAGEERQRAAVLRRRVILLRLALLVAFVFVALFFWKARDASRAAELAVAHQLAAQASDLISGGEPERLEEAILLAVESARRVSLLQNDRILRRSVALLPVLRLRHEGAVNAVAFSLDGRWVATASRDKTARLFEAATGKEVSRLQHQNTVSAVAFSPDGRLVATGSVDRTVRVFEAATGEEVSRLQHQNTVSAVAFSPDGRWVATASRDKTARVFEAATGNVVVPPIPHDDTVSSVAFSPDGARLATGSWDARARVFEVASRKEVARFEHGGAVNAVAFSPDGGRLATGADRTARVFEVATRKEVARLEHQDAVNAVAFSPEGGRLATGSWDKTARVFELAMGKEISRFVHGEAVSAVAFSPDGRRVLTGSRDETAQVFEVATSKEVSRFDHRDIGSAAGFSLDGRWLATGGRDRTARIFAAETGTEVARFEHRDTVSAVAFSPDGKRLATGSWDGTVRVLEAVTGAEISRYGEHGDIVSAVAFSADGRLVAGSWDKTARVFEAATGKAGPAFPHEDRVSAVAFSPDGRRVATGSWDSKAHIFEVATGKEISGADHEDAVTAVAFSPDGRWVASGSRDRKAQVFEAATGLDVAPPIPHEEPVNAVAFSADGRWLATESGDKSGRVFARVFEAATGKERWRLELDNEVAIALRFSPDGSQLLTISETTWGPGLVLSRHDLRSDDLVRAACSRLTRNLTEREWRMYFPGENRRRTCENLP